MLVARQARVSIEAPGADKAVAALNRSLFQGRAISVFLEGQPPPQPGSTHKLPHATDKLPPSKAAQAEAADAADS